MGGFFSKNDFKTSIDKEKGVVIHNFAGEITRSHAIKYMKKTIKNPDFQSSYHWLMDIREAKVLFKPEQVDQFCAFFIEHKEIFQKVKIAYVFSSAYNAKTVELIKRSLDSKNMDFQLRMFKNEGTALEWLESN